MKVIPEPSTLGHDLRLYFSHLLALISSGRDSLRVSACSLCEST